MLHQLQIRRLGDHLEMRYGQWAATRVVYTDGRPLPTNLPPTRLGYSIGRYEGDVLVVDSTARPIRAKEIEAVRRQRRDRLPLRKGLVKPWA